LRRSFGDSLSCVATCVSAVRMLLHAILAGIVNAYGLFALHDMLPTNRDDEDGGRERRRCGVVSMFPSQELASRLLRKPRSILDIVSVLPRDCCSCSDVLLTSRILYFHKNFACPGCGDHSTAAVPGQRSILSMSDSHAVLLGSSNAALSLSCCCAYTPCCSCMLLLPQ
jgi:hypothetical protein